MLVASIAGTVRYANAAAVDLLGRDIVGTALSRHLPEGSAAKFHDFLKQCSGSTSPTLGAFEFRFTDADRAKYRVYGSRLRGETGATDGVALRLEDGREDDFSVLARTVSKLNGQIRERLRVESRLEDLNQEQNLLLREVQHRVKNNLQMLLSMFSTASHNAQGDELKSFLESARGRLMAMSIVHDAMHHSPTLESSRTGGQLDRLVHSIVESLCPKVTLRMDIDDHEISNQKALPLALILNELVTNACKHALEDDCGTIEVSFRRADEHYEMTVRDDGPGIPEAVDGTDHLGLGLVKSLTRQLQGELSLTNDNGTCIQVRFP